MNPAALMCWEPESERKHFFGKCEWFLSIFHNARLSINCAELELWVSLKLPFSFQLLFYILDCSLIFLMIPFKSRLELSIRKKTCTKKYLTKSFCKSSHTHLSAWTILNHPACCKFPRCTDLSTIICKIIQVLTFSEICLFARYFKCTCFNLQTLLNICE